MGGKAGVLLSLPALAPAEMRLVRSPRQISHARRAVALDELERDPAVWGRREGKSRINFETWTANTTSLLLIS